MGLDLPGTYVYGYWPKELNDESVIDYGPNHFVGKKDSDDMLNLMLEKYFYAFGASMRSSTWWDRLWIMQEFVVGRDVFAMFDSRRVWWKEFRDVLWHGKLNNHNMHRGKSHRISVTFWTEWSNWNLSGTNIKLERSPLGLRSEYGELDTAECYEIYAISGRYIQDILPFHCRERNVARLCIFSKRKRQGH